MSDNPEHPVTTVDAAWKETVRDIFDDLHFGPINVFEGPHRDAARRIVAYIEKRHHDYFCGRKEQQVSNDQAE